MANLNLKEETLALLKGKVVVVTGGAQGIGSSTVKHLHEAGSSVVFGDMNVPQGISLATELNTISHRELVNVTFVELDVANYDSILKLFDKTLNLYGRVDAAIHCAAITETPGWFSPDLNMGAVRTPPSMEIFEVNLYSTFYFTQVALAAMNEGRSTKTPGDKSLILLSSISGFKDSPGLFAYTATKHGVLGLMRSLRGYLPSAYNVRINVICPWATDTPMFSSKVRESWVENNLPLNTPEQVARVILEGTGSPGLHGKAFYVAGGQAVDIEEGINRLESEWLGLEKAGDLAKGQSILGSGTNWTSEKNLVVD